MACRCGFIHQITFPPLICFTSGTCHSKRKLTSTGPYPVLSLSRIPGAPLLHREPGPRKNKASTSSRNQVWEEPLGSRLTLCWLSLLGRWPSERALSLLPCTSGEGSCLDQICKDPWFLTSQALDWEDSRPVPFSSPLSCPTCLNKLWFMRMKKVGVRAGTWDFTHQSWGITLVRGYHSIGKE
jgi:hypothetical protein